MYYMGALWAAVSHLKEEQFFRKFFFSKELAKIKDTGNLRTDQLIFVVRIFI